MTAPSDPPSDLPDRSFAQWTLLGLRAELSLWRHTKVKLALGALLLVPALYSVLYISSVWDPYGKLPQLPAALVNDDRGYTLAGREVHLGDRVAAMMQQQPPFRFIPYRSADAARASVRDGTVYFALILPPNFTARALRAEHDQPAAFSLVISEGSNYTASIVSQRFAIELAHTLNEKLNLERWRAVVGESGATADAPLTLQAALVRVRAGGRDVHAGAARIRDGTARLEAGLQQAAAGSGQLQAGSAELRKGVGQVADGMGRLAEGVDTMRARLPTDDQMRQLAAGSTALAAGAGTLVQGMEQLVAGAAQLSDGARRLQEGSAKVPLVGGKLAAGAGQLRDGLAKFGAGLGQASGGAHELRDGIQRLDAGVQPLSAGVVQLSAGLRLISKSLPASTDRDRLKSGATQVQDGNRQLNSGLGKLVQGSAELDAGAARLEQGSGRLAEGLDQLSDQFSAGFSGATPEALAAPVQPMIEKSALVANNGTGFTPYFVTLSLWVGTVMMTFVFFFRRLVEPMRAAPRFSRWLAKVLPLLAIGALQATVIVTVLPLVLGVSFAHPMLVWLTAIVGSGAFVTLILFLITLLGDAGRLLAVILLILQLAAAGGVYPVELSAHFYQVVHPFLPFTLLVRAFRGSMFDAFGGECWPEALRLIGVSVASALLGALLARWRYVPAETYGPAVEF